MYGDGTVRDVTGERCIRCLAFVRPAAFLPGTPPRAAELRAHASIR